MLEKSNIWLRFLILAGVFLFSFSCDKSEITLIVPNDGYQWPDNERTYWPTNAWETAPVENHNIDSSKMNLAVRFAENDSLARALLV